MSAVVSSVGSTVREAAGRLLARRRDDRDEYAFCPEDRYWFSPAYTAGKCPLCGVVAPGGAPPPPMLVRLDRSWYGLLSFALVSVVMSVLVLVMYFKS